MSTQPKTRLSPEQYLEIERAAEYKSEYWNGEMFAMAGATQAHNLLLANLIMTLGFQLRGRACQLYPSDMRVHVPTTGLYTYPDISVTCEPARFRDDRRDTLLNPSFLAEILSPSTEAYDRGRKFEHYRAIESLREYLLIAQDRIHVDLYTRQFDGRWVLSEASRLEDAIELASIECRLSLGDLYEKIDFAASS